MPSRLLSSFGLPVALTTGRLVITTATALGRHPIGPVVGAALVTTLLAGALFRAGLRRRLALRRGSPS